jgi:hypothetical protein
MLLGMPVALRMGRGGLAERKSNRPCEWHYTGLTLPVADSHHSSEWSPHHAHYNLASVSSSTSIVQVRISLGWVGASLGNCHRPRRIPGFHACV